MAETWILLLGPPRIESPGAPPSQPKGRKAWAVLACLALLPDGVSRSRTATLLFPDAADPLGALRWNLSELRRTLDGATITGDPLRPTLLQSWHCDALELVDSAAGTGPDPRRFDGQLLEGLSFADSPVFDSWLAEQRYRLENCIQSALYEVTKCAELYHRELGLPLPAKVRRALTDSAPAADPEITATAATVRSYLDAGSARILAIQGMLASDTAHYGDAVAAFAESRRLAREVRNRRQLAFSEALLGRVHLLRGDLELAAAVLDRALDGIAEELDHVRAICRRRPR
ncbi:hypothetical protein [Arthrobacter sp. AL12]|uniref:AfsR/SARP family transcriptional regulator n=1 Tax=Arthrobacter sp. AL12 TaxID=3042241 RepID=UPI00249A405C|nr:hypothetical protein [Arthrobacter sp. AL12]MDI3213285.1 hypothetical protein [Arthrobacter sp. AL12]